MIHFMKYKSYFLGLSVAMIIIAAISLVLWRLNPSIDFVGGALLEVKFADESNLDNEKIEKTAVSVSDVAVYSVVRSNENSAYIIRTNSINEAKKSEVLAAFDEDLSKSEEVRFETVGPTLGKELLIKTLTAMIIAAILITLYVTYQFKDRTYGLAAVLAMFHDTFILIGSFSLFGHFMNVEVDTLFVTAVLTTLSFSVHDTIVVFDRIRENNKQFPGAKFEDNIDLAITETLPRSLNNSMTIIFMLTALALLGGITIKWFAVALLIGTVLGTYSSPFVATPILLLLTKRKKK